MHRAKPFDATELLARLWKQNLPLLQERVATLETTSQEALVGRLTPSRRTEAADIAHKLAGSLGMFGYPRGTEIARELENLLEADGEPDPAALVRLSADLRISLPL